MFDAVKTAQDVAASMIKPGISGEVVHQAVVYDFCQQGIWNEGEGYIHSLGHGVGLEVHISLSGREGIELQQGKCCHK